MSIAPTTTDAPMLDAALRYIRRGWFVLPVNPAVPDTASDAEKRKAKAPCTRNGVDDASNSPLVIEAWFGASPRYPNARIAIAMGPSKLLAVDTDRMDAYAELVAEFPEIARTLSHETRRGVHALFKDPGGITKKTGWRPGLDIQAGNAYVIAPPSPHAEGAYTVIDGYENPAEMPPALIAAIGQGRQERADDGWKTAGTAIPAVLHEGDRRRSLLQIIGDGARRGLTPDEMRPMIEAINEGRAGNSGPLPADEVEGLLAAEGEWAEQVFRPPSLRVVREPNDDRFHFWSPGELLDADRDFRWLVGGLLVDPTYGMLAGESKTLKTHFQTMIALGVASGRTILDEFEVTKARPVTLYVGEGGRIPHTRLLERVATSMGISLRDIDLRVSYDVAGLQSDRFRESALDDLKQREPGLVGIDPLYAFHGTDTSASSLHEEGTLLSELHAPFNDAGATLQIVNHYNKTGQGTGLRRITQAGSAEWSDSWILVTHRETGDVEAGHFHLSLEVGSRQWGGRQWDVELELGAFSTETMEFDGDIAWELTPHGRGASSPKERQRADLRELLLGAPKTYSKTAARERVGGAVATFAEIWEEEEGRGTLRSGRIGANGAATRFEVWDWEELF